MKYLILLHRKIKKNLACHTSPVKYIATLGVYVHPMLEIIVMFVLWTAIPHNIHAVILKKILSDSFTDVIGKVRQRSSDRNIGTTWLLHNNQRHPA